PCLAPTERSSPPSALRAQPIRFPKRSPHWGYWSSSMRNRCRLRWGIHPKHRCRPTVVAPPRSTRPLITRHLLEETVSVFSRALAYWLKPWLRNSRRSVAALVGLPTLQRLADIAPENS